MAVSTTNTIQGFPDATSTGVPDGVTLTSSGDLNVTTPGVVINARDVKGTIWVMAPNVTIQNSRITSSDWTGIWIKPGITGTVVKDSEIQNVGSSQDGANGIFGSGTFLRNDIHNVENGINVTGPSLIQDNYIHNMYAPNVRAGTVWGGPHYDGIEINGGISGVDIRHNTIINENGQTSAVMINNDFGPVSDIQVDGNYLAGGGYTIYSDGSFSSTDKITGVEFTNNELGQGHWGYYYFKGNTPALSGNHELGTTWPTPVSGGGTTEPAPAPEPIPGPSEIIGTSGADVLKGTTGGDTLKGLAGNDTYTVNHTNDAVVEAAGAGIDKVESSISYTLAANVENLQFAGASAINGIGNGLNNTLIGNDAANVLKGGAGDDTLNGWGGKDTFFGEAGRDVFQFTSQYSANGDKVMDFVRGTDKLDFAKIDGNTSTSGDQAFIFDGYKTSGQNGHIWAVEDRAANVTHLYAKTGGFQFVVDLHGVNLAVSASDFFL